MKKQIEAIWPEILNILVREHDISPVAVSTFIEPLKLSSVDGSNLIFYVANGMRGIDFIKHKFYDMYLAMAIEQMTGQKVSITFTDQMNMENTAMITPTTLPKRMAGNQHQHSKYTFDTFVVGPTNKMAHAVAVAVAEAPGGAYNPFFLYGGAGLGKTHLMHSIAHHITMTRPDLKVLYVSSENFTNELIESINKNKNKEFRDKYRNIDVLLIDDIQFIIGKQSTQEEFFHTFNELYDANKQIVISSDKHPKEIATLEERLRSRFEWGITADIQPPDYETKMAILKKRAELESLDVSEEVMHFIASNINSNIRELEGALTKVCAFGKLENRPVTLEVAEHALKDTIENQREITPKLICDIVSEHFNISSTDIISKKKSKDIAHPRQICMYLCREYTDASLQNIGKLMGGRDHTTVMHGHEKIRDSLKTDDALRASLNIIIKKLNPPT